MIGKKVNDKSKYQVAMPMKITNFENSQLSKKENSQAMKINIEITKESSQVKKENSQSLKIIKIKGTKE